MYKKIMVPVDLEHVEEMKKALDTAAELARIYDIPVCYVAVHGTVPNRVAKSPEKFDAELNMFAHEQRDKYAIETACKSVVSSDVPAELDDKLIDAVDDVEADLVVMASHVPGVADHLH
ncbi:MAG: universal stress protein, partial [Xanthomonadaceae bacterium]|nr:universal stress protein [Xanthomonadaceae bacterium]